MGKNNRTSPTSPPPLAGLLRRRRIWLLGLFTAVGWQLCFAPFDIAAMAYVVLVPWTIAVATGGGRTGVLVGWLSGLVCFGVGLYWLTWVTMVGYIPLIAYMSVYWLVAAWFVRQATRRRMPLWIVLPVAWVALELARAYVMTGFPWFLLGHSQYRMTTLIQIADLTGVYGVSFLVAMVNGALADAALWWLARRDGKLDAVPSRRMLIVGVAVSAVVAAAMIGYGGFRLREAEQTCTPGPRIAVVQSAVPISLGGRDVDEREFFDRLMRLTEGLAGEPVDLIVWPETVLPGQFDQHWSLGRPWPDVNPAIYDASYRDWIEQMQQMHVELAALLGRLDAPLIAGTMAARQQDSAAALPDLFNSALMITTADGVTLDIVGVYDKMHCVPFSETVPFRGSAWWGWLHDLLRKCVPASMPQLTPGERVHRLRFGDGDTTWTTATPICYEGVFARVCRRMAYTKAGKQLDVLTNISNDGWFIWPYGDSHRPSSELDQHLSAYVFRAIENRLPVVRAVNTGISGFIDSSGRITSVVHQGRETRMIAGVATEQVLVDSRSSGYSSVGDLAALVCSAAAAVTGIGMWWRGRRAKSAKE